MFTVSQLHLNEHIYRDDPLVSSVPTADSCTAATRMLFDHLVGAGEQCRRHSEAQRPGGLEVNDQFERGRLLNWKIGRLGAFEDFVDVAGGAANQVGLICPIGNESAGFHLLAK